MFETNNVLFTFKFPIFLLILIAIIIYIIVFLAVLLPLNKVKKSNIIDEIKETNKSNKKVPGIIKKIFKQEGVLAYKYNKREKIRNTTIVFSLTISVCVFLVSNGLIINFLKSSNKFEYNDYKFDISSKSVGDVIKYLENNNLINGYFVQTKALQIATPENSSISDLHIKVPKDKISNNMQEILKNANDNDYKYEVIPYYFDENSYKEILKKAKIEELKENECILVNSQKIENSTYGELLEMTKYNIRR